jgi:alkanesulfonate monooxygenase SsuD/methylene tetrahydromethanopterin reductase-like flavin-dependent oxidoreductase (luciferase family)
MEGEFASLGARYEGRGRLLNEWLSAAASLFEQMPGRVGYEGRLLSVDGWMAPPLVRPGGPELWVAGVSRATLRRAEMTSVWHPVALPPDELRTMAAEFRARRPDGRVILRIGVYPRPEPQAGKDERGRHALAGPPEWIAERLSEYVAGGCNGFVLNLDHDSPGLEERVREFAAEIAPLLRAA